MKRQSPRLLDPKRLLCAFQPNDCYLVGVSGGRDSVALLHTLVDLGYRKLVVCHLNHRLRGRSGDADARFVEKLAARFEVDFASGAADVAVLARKKKISIELAARETRYSFFAKTAKTRRCRRIFLGHHADDLVETFLINLFRGAGTTGLGAMREISTRCIDDVDLTMVRPLLGVWRDDIDKYIRHHRLKFREDASNKSLAPTRNRLRHRVVPYLEKNLGRDVRQSLWRAANIAAEEENWIDRQLPDGTDVDLSVKALRDLPVALQRRQILKWLRRRKVANTGFDLVESVRRLLDPDARIAKVNLPQDRHVRRRAGKIFIE